MKKQAIALVCLGVLLVGCAGEEESRYVRDGKQYGVTDGVFRGRWWSYYERGASYLSGEYYDEAIADFEVALRGRDRDSWRARTYGLHFVEYFPNREMGVAYFHKGDLALAEEYLKLSIAEIETERAIKYLDDITRARIASGEVQDTTPPSFTAKIKLTRLLPDPAQGAPTLETETTKVGASQAPPSQRSAKYDAIVFASTGNEPFKFAQDSPAEDKATPAPPVQPVPLVLASAATIVTEPVFDIELESNDDTGVYCVMVAGDMLYQRGSKTENTQTKEVTLEEGSHKVALEAIDLAEKKVTQEVEVIVDLTSPTLGVFSPIEPTVTEQGTVILEGAGVDDNGMNDVVVDERLIAEGGGNPRIEFDSELPLGSGPNTFILAGRDVAGNESRSAVKIFRGDPDSLEAKLWLMEQKYPERLQLAMANLRLIDSLLAATPEQTGHEIRIKSPSLERPYYHNRMLQISGEVVTQSKVASLLINGVPFTSLTGAPKESFNKRIPIDPGAFVDGKLTQTVTIAATDIHGAELTKEVTVEVHEVGTSSEATKMPVAVLGFAGYQGVAEDRPGYMQHATSEALSELDRFNVLDRTRLEAVLAEQQMTADIADPAQALAIGGVIPVQNFLVGDVFAFGKGLELKSRVINTDTNEVLKTLDVYIEDASTPEALQRGASNLAAMMALEFPRLSGSVMEVLDGGRKVRLDIADDKLAPGAYVVFVSRTADVVDEETGEVTAPGEEVIFGRARIDSVSETESTATIVEMNESQEASGVAQGMPAVTM